MSFIMDLPPDVETRLEAEASRQGVPAAEIALRLFTDNLPPAKVEAEEAERKRLAAIDEAFGSLSHLGGGLLEERHRERQADIERAARSYGVAL